MDKTTRIEELTKIIDGIKADETELERLIKDSKDAGEKLLLEVELEALKEDISSYEEDIQLILNNNESALRDKYQE